MKKIFAFLFCASILSANLFVSADAKGRVNHRQVRQQRRIHAGLHSGELNKREAVRLEKRQYALAKDEARMRRSGDGLTNTERAKLELRQDKMSSSIYNQKHDEQEHK